MTGLVDLIFPDGIVSLDSIVKVNAPFKVERHGMTMSDREIVMTDGTKHVMGAAFVDRLMRRPTHLVPVEAGTFALHAWASDEERGVIKSPVIAWALCLDGEVRPVTAQGVNDGDMMHDGEGYVLMPGGSVQSVGEHVDPVWFDTLTEYSEHMWAALAARTAAAPNPDPNGGGVA